MNWFGFLGFPSKGVSFLGISLEFRHKHKLPKAMKSIIDLSPNEADHPQPLWLKLWCYQTVLCDPQCSNHDQLFVLVASALTIDVTCTKGRLWYERFKVFGWKAGLFSVALWTARLKGDWPWRGSTSTLALAASQPWLPSKGSQHHHTTTITRTSTTSTSVQFLVLRRHSKPKLHSRAWSSFACK